MANDGPRAYVERLTGAFAQAASGAGLVERSFELAGHQVTLRFAGDALVGPMTRALAHLPVVPPGRPLRGTPSLTVSLWDKASTGAPMPPPAWNVDSYGARGEIAGFSRDGVHAAFAVGADSLSVFDGHTGQALWWTRDAARVPYYERGAPLRAIFHFWAEAMGLHLVHGAVVGEGGRGVLLAARGGSGKSSTALSCLLDGMRYAGDDYCLVGLDPPRAFSLYSTGKLAAADVPLFGALEPCLDNRARLPEEKALFFLHDRFADRLAPELALRAVLVPRFGRGPASTCVPGSAAASALALAPSTIFQQAGAGRSSLAFMAALARAVPGWFLELGSDRAAVPRALRAWLAAEGAPA